MTSVDSRREIILAFLKTRGHATLGEVAAHMEVSKQAALKHLEALDTDGLTAVAHAQSHGRGRPENVYSLTPAAAEHFPHTHRELDFDARVRELAGLATEHGHMAEVVELSGGGLAIRHCNCPIQDVAVRTPLPCKNEQEMYERLLGAPVERSTWVREAASDCTYQVNEGSKRVG